MSERVLNMMAECCYRAERVLNMMAECCYRAERVLNMMAECCYRAERVFNMMAECCYRTSLTALRHESYVRHTSAESVGDAVFVYFQFKLITWLLYSIFNFPQRVGALFSLQSAWF